MICRQCGTEIADKALICYRCGTATSEPRVAPPVAGRGRRPRRRLLPTVIGVILLIVLALLWGLLNSEF